MFFWQTLLLLLCLPLITQAASLLERSPCERATAADAVALAELVLHHGTLVNGQIQTKFVFATVEPLKGKFPAYFEVYAPGGVFHNEGLADSRLPELSEGAPYLVFIEVGERLRFHDGVAGANLKDIHIYKVHRYPHSSNCQFRDLLRTRGTTTCLRREIRHGFPVRSV